MFLNTSEPVWEDGSTRNPTKSICDPFVFNTVLTRAKALVVCVGNPFNLLRSEQHMVKKYGNRGKCWSEFLKCCLQHNTLHAVDAGIQKRCKASLESILLTRTFQHPQRPTSSTRNPVTLTAPGTHTSFKTKPGLNYFPFIST